MKSWMSMVALGCAVGSVACTASSYEVGAHAPHTVANPATLTTDGLRCIRVQRGVSGDVADTRIAERWPDRSYGTEAVAFAGRVGSAARYVLLDFDLSGVPAGTTITRATLIMTAAAGGGVGRVTAHRITSGWNEATTTWSGFSDAFDPYVEASARTTAEAPGQVVLDVTRLVRSWRSGEQAQHGMLLEQSESSTTFVTSEGESAGQRPRLEVCFSPADPG